MKILEFIKLLYWKRKQKQQDDPIPLIRLQVKRNRVKYMSIVGVYYLMNDQ